MGLAASGIIGAAFMGIRGLTARSAAVAVAADANNSTPAAVRVLKAVLFIDILTQNGAAKPGLIAVGNCRGVPQLLNRGSFLKHFEDNAVPFLQLGKIG